MKKVLPLALALVLSGAGTARAGEPGLDEPPPALRYRIAMPSEPARAVGEELLVLGFGYAQYISDKQANARDFDLSFDWASLKSKLLFESVAFDNNHFATNWATHPIAGYFYYGVARANRLSLLESFLLGAGSSTIWEVFGEWREQASINDLFVTPVSGLAVGEPLFQLGALFQRARPSVGAQAASWVFGSLKNVNDSIDEAEPERSFGEDELGLPLDVWHRFTFSFGTSVTKQDRAPLGADGKFALGAHLVALPDYLGEEAHHRVFDSGEVSSLSVAGATSTTGLTDFLFDAGVMPLGYFDQDGRGREGHATLTGLRVAFEYAVHDYDRDRRRSRDEIAFTGAGLSFDHRAKLGPIDVRIAFDATGVFAGVSAYALPEYEAVHGKNALSSVLANESYHHAIGLAMRPLVGARIGPLEVDVDGRLDAFEAIEGLDRQGPAGGSVSASDRRSEIHAASSLGSKHFRFEMGVSRRYRQGKVGDVETGRGETEVSTAFVVRY